MAKWVLCKIIQLYQVCISPFTPSSCRFYPTCSNYAIQAIEQHGILKGLFYAVNRLKKCHPFSKNSGVDLVPNHSKK